MIREKDILALPLASRISFVQSTVTAQKTIIASLSPTGATAGQYNDAVLELNRLNYFLTAAKQAKS